MVAVAGTGSIGVAFAIVFARAGLAVRAWDAVPDALDRARVDIDLRLALLHEHELLTEPPADIAARVSFHTDLREALCGVELVLECAPEELELKRSLFSELDQHSEPDAVLASASSALTPSRYSEHLPGRERVMGAHPGNPPYLLPVIELIPSPYTSKAASERATHMFRQAGLKPVLVRKEIEGFLFNRLQGALLREAYCLLRDGVADVDDIDEVVRNGLGLRWSVVGPFETVDLNTRGGIAAHAARMGPAYERMGGDRGQHDPWTAELVELATTQRRALLPLEDWAERVRWRDEQLMELLRIRLRTQQVLSPPIHQGGNDR
jgi:3-hydroxyacyl-CoA dehydrogenase